MLIHFVPIKSKESATPGQSAALSDASRRYPDQIDVIHSFQHGRDVGHRPTNAHRVTPCQLHEAAVSGVHDGEVMVQLGPPC